MLLVPEGYAFFGSMHCMLFKRMCESSPEDDQCILLKDGKSSAFIDCMTETLYQLANYSNKALFSYSLPRASVSPFQRHGRMFRIGMNLHSATTLYQTAGTLIQGLSITPAPLRNWLKNTSTGTQPSKTLQKLEGSTLIPLL
jgi:hypothetical protein